MFSTRLGAQFVVFSRIVILFLRIVTLHVICININMSVEFFP